jgi:NADH-quinone oxidoreductase subunit M
MLAKITHGTAPAPSAGPAPASGHAPAAVSAQEYAAWVPLIALTLLVGLWPKTLLDVTAAPVRALFGGG